MTVEELLHSHCDVLMRFIDAKAALHVSHLREELKNGVAGVGALMQPAHAFAPATKAKGMGSGANAATRGSDHKMTVTVLNGPHKEAVFSLRPRAGEPAPVGRSTGKRFKERGVSLPQDSEVSTTHGRFEALAGGGFCFTDTGSTNGSSVDG
ncbi:unnamed protein product [Phaeothamnion confervicola]